MNKHTQNRESSGSEVVIKTQTNVIFASDGTRNRGKARVMKGVNGRRYWLEIMVWPRWELIVGGDKNKWWELMVGNNSHAYGVG